MGTSVSPVMDALRLLDRFRTFSESLVSCDCVAEPLSLAAVCGVSMALRVRWCVSRDGKRDLEYVPGVAVLAEVVVDRSRSLRLDLVHTSVPPGVRADCAIGVIVAPMLFRLVSAAWPSSRGMIGTPLSPKVVINFSCALRILLGPPADGGESGGLVGPRTCSFCAVNTAS